MTRRTLTIFSLIALVVVIISVVILVNHLPPPPKWYVVCFSATGEVIYDGRVTRDEYGHRINLDTGRRVFLPGNDGDDCLFQELAEE